MVDKDFEHMTAAEQRAELKYLYMRRDEGVGSNVRFMDDLEHMFVEEDCGGDLNFTIYNEDGALGFASLNPPEVVRLYRLLEERVRDYPASVKGDINHLRVQINRQAFPHGRPW